VAIDFVQETSTVVERFARQGKLFVVSKRWAGVASGSSVDFVINNPADSGRDLYLLTIQITGTDQAWIDMFVDSQGLGSGMALSPANKYIGHSMTAKAVIEVDGSYTPGTKVHETVLPGGSGRFATGGSAELGVGGIIPPGHNLHVRLTNKSANANDLSIRVVWWEKERG